MSFGQPTLRRYTTLQNIFLAASGSILLAACGGSSNSGGGGGTTTPTSYTVGGTISGLTGTGLVLQDNGGDSLTVAANATSFTFATSLATAAAYAVTVKTQPTGQTCAVATGSGTIAAANVTNVAVTCTTTASFTVGGTVSGLTASGLVLQDNAGDNLTVAANATSFTFATHLATAAAYAVTVKTQPTGQTCAVASGSGTIAAANITSVAVTCSTPTDTIGGNVTGLTGTGLVLQDNGGNNFNVTSNGAFTFTTPLSVGAAYAVTVSTQPTSTPAQFCTVAAGTGNVASGNVTNVAVTCRNAGRYLLTTVSLITGQDGLISLFDIGSDGSLSLEKRQPTSSLEPMGIAFDTSGPYAYVAYANDPVNQIWSETINPATPSITDNDNVPLGSNGEALSVTTDPAKPYVYVGGTSDFTHSTGQIFGFSVSTGNGTLNPPLGSADMDGGYPYSIAVDPAGKLLFAPQPVTGSSENTLPGSPNGQVWVFQINNDGSLTAANSGAPVTYQSGGTTNTPYAVAVDPNGGYVYFTDDTANTVTAYTYSAIGALAEVVGTTPLPVGTKPTGVAIDPTGQFLYVSNGDATVSAFTINATTGALTAAGSAVPTGANASTSPTGVQVDPSGQYVYVATGDDASVAAFHIDRTTGELTEIGTPQSALGSYTGSGASAVAID